VYVLDEPLLVGQGGADVESEAAAGSWQQERQQRGGPPVQQQLHGKAKKLDASSRSEIEEPVEQLLLGGAGGISDDVAAMEVETAPDSRPEPPAAGSIKFAPTGVW